MPVSVPTRPAGRRLVRAVVHATAAPPSAQTAALTWLAAATAGPAGSQHPDASPNTVAVWTAWTVSAVAASPTARSQARSVLTGTRASRATARAAPPWAAADSVAPTTSTPYARRGRNQLGSNTSVAPQDRHRPRSGVTST